jgi:glycosyltransferase involved in cell wall biosynthesis
MVVQTGANKADSGVNSHKKVIRPAFVLSERAVYDYSEFIHRLLIGLADESIPVTLICPAQSNIESFSSAPAEIIRYPDVNLPVINRLALNKIFLELEKFRPTVLHCLCPARAAMTSRIAYQLDIPYILAIDSTARQSYRFKLSCRRCSFIIAPTRNIADNFIKSNPRFVDKVKCIIPGTFVDKDSLCFSDPSRLPGIVISDCIDNIKDYKALFNATKQLIDLGYEFSIVLMGPGKADKQLWKFLSSLGLNEYIIVVGVLQPWRSVLAAGDIYIQTSPGRSYNPYLLEAMGVGAAIISYRGCINGMIIPDETAAIFEFGDQQSIKNTIQSLLDNPEYAKKLAAGAQKYIKINHTVNQMVTAILQSYLEAQQGRNGR